MIASGLIVVVVVSLMLLTAARVVFLVFNPFAHRIEVRIQNGNMHPQQIEIGVGEPAQVRVVTDASVEIPIPGLGIGSTHIGEVHEPDHAPVIFVGSDDPGCFAIVEGRTGTRLGTVIVK